MRVTLGKHTVAGFAEIHAVQRARYPAATPAWQPVHTVYVPADRFSPDTVTDWGGQAMALLREHLPDPGTLSKVFSVSAETADEVHDLVARKLAAEPIEDLRVDFEDGYGLRPDQEDGDAARAARAVAELYRAGALPRRWGLRVKSFADGDAARSTRTLDGFLTTLLDDLGELPPGFTITFPKVLMEEYLHQFADFLGALESALALPARLGFEIQVEAPQTVRFLRADLAETLQGRLRAAHFGVFDYTAALGLPPHEQRLDHPACDHARHQMQTAFAGTGVELCDGSLAAAPASADAADVHALWRRHASLVGHSLAHGFYQGWDMHPAHLVARYATVYAFHLARYEEYATRERAWSDQREADGGVLDEPATIKTLTAALLRADLALGRQKRI